MRAVSFAELDGLIEQAQENIGDKVTDILFTEAGLTLGLRDSKTWMTLIPGGQCPVFLLSDKNPLRLKKQIKPLYLFLKAHLLGKRLISISRRQGFGRVLDFEFEDREGQFLKLEVILIPPAGNITAVTAESRISLHKPREIVAVEEKSMGAEVRNADQILIQWMEWFDARNDSKPTVDISDSQKKKERILKSLDENLLKIDSDLSREVAEYLVVHRNFEDVPSHWQDYIDLTLSVDENIEALYSRVKRNKQKRQGLLERKKEICQSTSLGSGVKVQHPAVKKQESLLHEARGRTREVEEGITAYIGKSAEDNLKLLRNARPWHIWVHARDFASSHGVIAFNKGKKIGPEVLQKVGQWILEQTLSSKVLADWKGSKCQLIVCECRYVTPVKGDKKGRVTHKNEKTFTFVV